MRSDHIFIAIIILIAVIGLAITAVRYTVDRGGLGQRRASTTDQGWRCPVENHHEVEWDGDSASCVASGCCRSSNDPTPRGYCACEEYDCDGACCGPGQCSCSVLPKAPSDG